MCRWGLRGRSTALRNVNYSSKTKRTDRRICCPSRRRRDGACAATGEDGILTADWGYRMRVLIVALVLSLVGGCGGDGAEPDAGVDAADGGGDSDDDLWSGDHPQDWIAGRSFEWYAQNDNSCLAACRAWHRWNEWCFEQLYFMPSYRQDWEECGEVACLRYLIEVQGCDHITCAMTLVHAESNLDHQWCLGRDDICYHFGSDKCSRGWVDRYTSDVCWPLACKSE